MIIQDENRLRTWISHLVEDISDAEPEALAKYVIALVRKPLGDADLEQLCSDKLNVFLQSHTDSFVSQLFGTLRSGKYLTDTLPARKTSNNSKSDVALELDEDEKQLEESVTVAEADELVLTDPESEHEDGFVMQHREAEPSSFARRGASKDHRHTRSSVPSSKDGKNGRSAVGGGNSVEQHRSGRANETTSAREDGGRRVQQQGIGDASAGSGSTTRKAPTSATVVATTVTNAAVSTTTAPTTAATTKPIRKRISPPRRTPSPERRGSKKQRASSPQSSSAAAGMQTRRRGGPNVGGPTVSSSSSSSSRQQPSSSSSHPRQQHYRESLSSRRGRSKERGGDREYRPISRSRSRSPLLPSRSSRKEKRTAADLLLLDSCRSSARRHRCRDFHEKGFCMRGDTCPFDHGLDPVVVEDTALEKIIVRSVAGGGGVPTALFDPISGSGIYGQNPPPPGMESNTPIGLMGLGGIGDGGAGGTPTTTGAASKMMTTEGYNPESPALTATATQQSSAVTGIVDFSVPPPPIPQFMVQTGGIRSAAPAVQNMIYPPGTVPTAASTNMLLTGPPLTQSQQQYPGSAGLVQLRPAGHVSTTTGTNVYGGGQQQQPFGAPGAGGIGMGRMPMRGGLGGRFRPYNTNSMASANRNFACHSLLVKKIPVELNKIAQLDQHFGRFGPVTNIQVQYEGQPDTALVTFKTRRDAVGAYKSTEPIFNNRFIKVFWQNEAQTAMAENATSTATGAAQGAGEPKDESLPTYTPLSTTTAATMYPPPAATTAVGVAGAPGHFKQRRTAPVNPRYYSKTFPKSAPPTWVPVTAALGMNDPVEGQGKQQQEAEQVQSGKFSVDENENEAEQKMQKDAPETTTTVLSTEPEAPMAQPALAPLQQQQQTPPIGKRAIAMDKADSVALETLMKLHGMKTQLYAQVVDQQKMLLQKLKKQNGTAKVTGTTTTAENNNKEQKLKLMELLRKTEQHAEKARLEVAELRAKINAIRLKQQAGGMQKKRARMSLMFVGNQQQQNAENGNNKNNLDENNGTENSKKNGTGMSDAGANAIAKNKGGSDNGSGTHAKTATKNKMLFRLCKVVYVFQCPLESAEQLIMQMETYGDLFDYDINTEPRVFTYKNPVDAQKAVADAASAFASVAKITVQWAPTAKGVRSECNIVPDTERKPSERVTPRDLLASLDYDDEDDDEEGAGAAGSTDDDDECFDREEAEVV